MEDVSVSSFKLGEVDGKKEARDPDFEQLFYLGDGYYDELEEQNKYIIIGRKGTGKSVLINYYKKQIDKKDNAFCKIISVPSFMKKKLRTFDYDKLNTEELEEFWKYVLLRELSGLILDNKVPLLKGLKKLNFKNHDKSIDSLLELKEKELENIGKINGKLANSFAGVSAEVETKESVVYKTKKYYDVIDELETTVIRFLKDSESDYYLIFDDLEELDKKFKGDKEYFYDVVLSFFMALEYLNDLFYECGTNSKIITTIRQDLLDIINLDSHNLNKIINSSSIKIEWYSPLSKENPEETQIMKMLLHKIRKSTPTYENFDNAELYEKVFPSIKDTSTTQKNNCLEYLMARSFGRPRDLILFLKVYQKLYKNDLSFDFSNFDKCLRSYSNSFYTEIVNEINLSPYKEDILTTIEVIKKFQNRYFKFNDLQKFYEQNKKIYSWNIQSINKSCVDLYQLGVIGNCTIYPGKKKKNTYWFSYRDGSPKEPDMNKDFSVHFALLNNFSL